jgi:hypothetical protein
MIIEAGIALKNGERSEAIKVLTSDCEQLSTRGTGGVGGFCARP